MTKHTSLLAVAALSIALASPAPAEEAKAEVKRPELQTFEVSERSVEGVAKVFADLKERGVEGLPEGWESLETVAESALLKGLDLKEARLHAVVLGGKFAGLAFEHGGISFLYNPPQPFAVEMPTGGRVSSRALVVRPDGSLQERPLGGESASGQNETLAVAICIASRRMLLGDARMFDGGEGRGRVPEGRVIFNVDGRGKPLQEGPTVAERGRPLLIANAYKDKAPQTVTAGQLFWNDKALMAAQEPGETAKVRAVAVGYMADMKDPKGGDVLFFHGRAAPDARGLNKDWKREWALYYIPKVEKGLEVEGGNTTARPVSLYAMADLSSAKTVKTDVGTRLDLAGAMQQRQTYLSVRNLTQPETTALLAFGAPVGSPRQAYRSFVSLDGRKFQELEVKGERYVVRTGKLYSVKEPPSAKPSLPVAPAPKREPAAPVVVLGPQKEPLPVPARPTPLKEALVMPESAPRRAAEVRARTEELKAENPLTLQAELRRNELSELLRHPQAATRLDAAAALLALEPRRPSVEALSAVRWFMTPESRVSVHPDLRVRALAALTALSPASTAVAAPQEVRAVFPDLVRTITDRSEDPRVREQALSAYANLMHDDAAKADIYRTFTPEMREILPAAAAARFQQKLPAASWRLGR